MTVEDKLIVSYTIYIALMFVWLVFIWGATGYVVFVLGRSAWWFVLTCLLSRPIQPATWRNLIRDVAA